MRTPDMRVVVAPNALKGSLSALEAAEAIARGVQAVDPTIEVAMLPVADGGDGTTAVLCRANQGTTRDTVVPDPLGRPVRASFGLIEAGRTALVDVAAASGLALLDSEERDPMLASSRGTGKLIQAALDAGVDRLILGVGGSATVDGGAGALAALGIALLDSSGAPIPNGGAGLARLARIDLSRMHPALKRVPIRVACDVDSPLLGTTGAARLFGPQKGANPEMVLELERNLAHFAQLIALATGRDVLPLAAGGAGGGLAAGFAGLVGAKLESGIDLVLENLGFDQALVGTDWVVTAEGFLDRQSLHNKAPHGVGRWAQRRGVPVIAFSGGIADDLRPGEIPGVISMFSICRRVLTLNEALERASELLESATRAVFQTLHHARLGGQQRLERTPQ